MLNELIMCGRLVDSPELKTTANGTAVTTFRIAVQRDVAGDNSEQITDFFTVVAWRADAIFITKYFTKGKLILVKGSLFTRKYVDKNSQNRTVFEINLSKAYFCGDKPLQSNTNNIDSDYCPEDFDVVLPEEEL